MLPFYGYFKTALSLFSIEFRLETINPSNHLITSSTGAHQACPSIHHHSTGLSHHTVVDQELLADLHTVPPDVGGDDRYTQVPGLCVHATGVEDTGRYHAGDVEASGSR